MPNRNIAEYQKPCFILMSALKPGLRTVDECITKTSNVKKLWASTMPIEGKIFFQGHYFNHRSIRNANISPSPSLLWDDKCASQNRYIGRSRKSRYTLLQYCVLLLVERNHVLYRVESPVVCELSCNFESKGKAPDKVHYGENIGIVPIFCQNYILNVALHLPGVERKKNERTSKI